MNLKEKHLQIMAEIQRCNNLGMNITIVHLARFMNMKGPTMSEYLDRLEKWGYIKRTSVISKIQIIKKV